MATTASGVATGANAPVFLTVEEADAILRIGRTSAYLLAQEYEATAGAGGLLVVRFGRQLRVPLARLVQLADGAAAAADHERDAKPTTPSRTRHNAHVDCSRANGAVVSPLSTRERC